MTITVANTELTNTFDYQRDRLNELADAMTNKTVTVNSNTTTGNATVNGTFTSATLVANVAIRGGDETTVDTLTVASNLEMDNTFNISVGNTTVNTQIVAGNVYLNGSTLVIGNTTSNITATDSLFSLGDATNNVTINSTSISIGTFSVNNSYVGVTNSISVGNSSVNVQINSTSYSFDGSIFANSTSLTHSGAFSFRSNSSVVIPVGTLGERPSGSPGHIRYNTTDSVYEVYVISEASFTPIVTQDAQIKIYDEANTLVFPV